MQSIWSPADRPPRQGSKPPETYRRVPVPSRIKKLYRICRAILAAAAIGLLGSAHALAADAAKTQITRIATFNHPQAAGLAWSGDGKYLASAGLGPLANSAAAQRANPHVAIWDIAVGKLLAAYRRPGPYTYVSLIGAGPLVLSSYQTAPGWNSGVAFSLWDPRTGNVIRHVAGLAPADERQAMQKNHPHAYSYNHSRGLFALTRGRDKTLYVYDTSNWTISSRIAIQQDPLQLTFSPDGKKIAFNEQYDIIIVDIDSGNVVQRFRPFRTIIGGLAWAPDSRRLALIVSGVLREPDGDALPGEGSQIKVWDVATGKFLQSYPGEFGGSALYPDVITWSAGGRYIATSTADHRVRVWSVAGAQQPYLLNQNPIDTGGISFSPVERLLAVASLNALNIYQID